MEAYTETRKLRKAERKAKAAALDAALRAYVAARNEARANGTQMPNMQNFIAAQEAK